MERVSAAHAALAGILPSFFSEISLRVVIFCLNSAITEFNSLKAKFFIIFLFLSFQAFFLSAQTVYVIREVEFDIDGRTRPFALLSHGEFLEGERIIGQENLDRYLALKRQLLLNQRVLEDVRIDYLLGEREEDGALPVSLLVYVKDSWNLIVLPYPRYDSNDGFSLTLKARDYNFLGTMRPIRFDLGYRQNDGDDTLDFSLESTTPFQAAGLDWRLRFDHYFSYTFGDPLYYQNVTGVSVDFPWQSTTFSVGLNQYLTFNEENSNEDMDIFGLSSRHLGAYASTDLFASWEIPLGIELGDFGSLAYKPSISERINYPYGAMDDSRKPVTTFSHSIGFGRVDWIGNYRKGLLASIDNGYSWFFDRSDAPLKISLSGNMAIHWPLSGFLGLSSRLNYRQWWHWSTENEGWIPYYYAGDRIRGVLNEHLRAERILSFNFDLPIRVLRFWPSEWLDNESFRFFNFEMHLSPFTDLALLQGPYNRTKNAFEPSLEETRFILDDMIHTAGLELVIFPGLFRSLYLRASMGYNINKIRNEGMPPLRLGFIPLWDEIFIGLEHHY